MRKERKQIALRLLEPNNGQLEWLPKNPRQWTKEDVERTAHSIDEDTDFLEDRPLLVVAHGKKYIVFAGNLRREGSIKAGLETVPCVQYHPETEEDYTTVKRRAIKDNGAFGSWDFDRLGNEWDDLDLLAMGVPAWEEPEMTEEEPEAQEDDFDENTDEIHVRCKPGDVWQLGDHRLMCGDSTDLETVRKLMGGGSAKLMITDPPYGVAIGDKNKMQQEHNGGNRITENILNDDLPVDNLYDILVKAMANSKEACEEDASWYVFSPPGGDMGLMMMMMMMKDAGLRVRHHLVWVKNAPTFSMRRLDYDYRHEAILYTWGARHHFYGGVSNTVFEDELDVDQLKKDELVKLVKEFLSDKVPTSVIRENKPLKNDLHPTMKPVTLIARLMKNSSRKGEEVLDLFGGSGTTMIAAEQLGRRCYMMELDPHYCDVIIARWEKLTGREAVKID